MVKFSNEIDSCERSRLTIHLAITAHQTVILRGTDCVNSHSLPYYINLFLSKSITASATMSGASR